MAKGLPSSVKKIVQILLTLGSMTSNGAKKKVAHGQSLS